MHLIKLFSPDLTMLIMLSNALITVAHSNVPFYKAKKLSDNLSHQESKQKSHIDQEFDASSPNELKCIACDGLDNCKKIYNNANLIDSYTTCKSGEKCFLHYETKMDSNGKIRSQVTYILKSGCQVPVASEVLDGSGCISKLSTYTGNKKWTPGTRTCYCNDRDGCNDNRLNCYICTGERTSYAPYDACYDLSKLEITNNSKALELGAECFISSKDNDYGDDKNVILVGMRLSILDSGHPDYHQLPIHCEPDPTMHWTAWGKRDPIKQSCACFTPNCNEIIADLAKHLSVEPPSCHRCDKEDYDSCNSLSTQFSYDRFKEVCFLKYVKNSTNGKFVFDSANAELSTLPPGPDGKPLRNGCTLPVSEEGRLTRKCYCDTPPIECNDYNRQCNTACNTPVLLCHQCVDEDCENVRSNSPGNCIDPDKSYGEPRKECYISYDNSIKPAKIEAGCRDFNYKVDGPVDHPDCDEDNNWSKKTAAGAAICRCETPGCNRMVEKFFLPDPKPGEVRCFSELPCNPDLQGGDDDEELPSCKKDAKQLQVVNCRFGCRFTRQSRNDSRVVIQSRGCVKDNVTWTSILCKKVQEYRYGKENQLQITTHGSCSCKFQKCNVPWHDSEFEDRINIINDTEIPVIPKKTRMRTLKLSGASSIYSCYTLKMAWFGGIIVIFGVIFNIL